VAGPGLTEAGLVRRSSLLVRLSAYGSGAFCMIDGDWLPPLAR
jgi:hypothetical protein